MLSGETDFGDTFAASEWWMGRQRKGWVASITHAVREINHPMGIFPSRIMSGKGGTG